MRAVVFGPPCGGKTTIANTIAEHFAGVSQLSSRGMCLSEIAEGTSDGITWHFCDQKRLPLPKGLTNRIAWKYLRNVPSFVIDGYPKTPEELDYFIEVVGSPTHLFVVRASLKDVLFRARSRLECPSCLASFSTGSGICPICYASLRRRPDDNPEIVEERFQEYLLWETNTLPGLRRAASTVYEGSSEELLKIIGTIPDSS